MEQELTADTSTDVFISSTDEGLSKKVADATDDALARLKIKTFRSHDCVRMAEKFVSKLRELLKAEVLLLTLCKESVDSTRFLDDLVRIHERAETSGQTVLPVFCDVEPTDVQHQTSGSFARAFRRYEKKFDSQTIQNWKKALSFVGGMTTGYSLKQVNGNLPKLVDLIVDRVLRELRSNRLGDAKIPIEEAGPTNLKGANKGVHLDVDDDAGSPDLAMRMVPEALSTENFQEEIFLPAPKEMSSVGRECLAGHKNGSFSSCIQTLSHKINGEEDLNSITSIHPFCNENGNYSFMSAHDDGACSSFGSFSNCDVFLNFRGEDTRNGFTGFLYRTLKREGVNVFMDTIDMWGGEEIKPELLKAIRGSKISIPVYSEGYAESEWCLMELEEMVKCHGSNSQKLLPIFYDVEPTDVRHQTSTSFARSIYKHKEKFNAQTIENWKQALTFAGGVTGYELKHVNGNQASLVNLVVDWVSRELSSDGLGDNKNPIKETGASNLVGANKRAHLNMDEETSLSNLDEILLSSPKQMYFVGGRCSTQWRNGSFSSRLQNFPYKINCEEYLNSITSQHPLWNRNCNIVMAHDRASSFSSYGSFIKYDVFLNFRGADTRNNFTSFLYDALIREGINVFMDSTDLSGGEEIKPTLLKAIQESEISIPIFSKSYANSKWCLMELDEMVQCHKSNGQTILPIFYDVEQTDVLNQTGSFAESFERYSENFDAQTIENWKEALTYIGGIPGYDLKEVNGNEAKLVSLIVDRVLRELNRDRPGESPSKLVRPSKGVQFDMDEEAAGSSNHSGLIEPQNHRYLVHSFRKMLLESIEPDQQIPSKESIAKMVEECFFKRSYRDAGSSPSETGEEVQISDYSYDNEDGESSYEDCESSFLDDESLYDDDDDD